MGALADFPFPNNIRIAGRSFQANTSFEPYRRDAFRHRTIPAQRESINLAGKTGEGTVNSEGLWRYAALDWSYGAGQLYADRDGAIANRFYQSKGVNPWVRYQVSLLQDVKQVRTSTNTPQDTTAAISIGPLVFIKKPQTVEYTSDYSTFTAVPSLPVLTGTDIFTYIAYDSSNVYVCSPTKGLWTIPVNDLTVSAAVQVTADPVDWVGAAAGRVFASQGPNLYDVSQLVGGNNNGSAHLPNPPLMIHPEPLWVWHCCAAGSSSVYFSGNAETSGPTVVANTPSAVYRSTIEPDGTNMQAPVVALPLPHNEYVQILFSYLNFIFIGTTQGVRMCRTVSANDPSGNSGDLISGPVIPNYLGPAAPCDVTGFTANGRYVWFSWQQTNAAGGYSGGGYDGVSVGLGRMDLGTMVDELAPAYASDLMIDDANAYIFWLDWDPINNGPLMSVTSTGSRGVWTQDPSNLESDGGFVDQGRVTNNIPDDKIVAQALLTRDPGTAGAITVQLSTDGSTYTAATPLATNLESNPPTVLTSGPYAPTDGVTGMFRGSEINVRAVLVRDAVSHNTGPTLRRMSTRSIPAVVSGTRISAVLKLYGETTEGGMRRPNFSYDDYLYLENLRLGQIPVLYQEGYPGGQNDTPAIGYQAIVTVDEIDWLPFKEKDQAQFGFDGDMVVYLKEVVG